MALSMVVLAAFCSIIEAPSSTSDEKTADAAPKYCLDPQVDGSAKPSPMYSATWDERSRRKSSTSREAIIRITSWVTLKSAAETMSHAYAPRPKKEGP